MADIPSSTYRNPVIWKYTIDLGGSQLEIPKVGKILCVQEQEGFIRLWVRVYPEREKETRNFVVIGTGNPISINETIDCDTYIGSVMIKPFVWHVFERMGPPV